MFASETQQEDTKGGCHSNEDGIDKRYPVLSEVPVSSEEGALPLYADLLAVRAGSDSEIWCFQRKSAGIMENTEM